MATQAFKDIVQKMYIGYYGRPGDDPGLIFWADQLEANEGDLNAIIDAFGNSEEFTNRIAGLSNADLVEGVYQSLFGRASDQAGKDFYVGKLDSQEMSLINIVKAIIDGATDTDALDATTIANKVVVANHFTAAVVTENKEYTPDQIPAAQTVLAGVTADAATIDAGTTAADAAVADFPGIPFSLPTGIARLQAAEDAVDAFLITADGDEDANTSATEADVAAGVTTTVNALDVLVAGDYAGSSTALRAALLSDQETANAAVLTTAQTAQTDAQADVDAVAGLGQAVTDLNAAKDATAAADAAEVTATAALAGAVANYNGLNADAVTVAGDGTAADAGAVDLIVLDGDNLVLDSGITETTNPGVTALLDASVALEAAETAAIDAAAAEAAALLVVNSLDLTTAAETALADVGAAMTAVTPVDAAAPTTAEIESETTGLTALIATLDTSIGGVAFDTDEGTTQAAHAALTADAVTAGYISAADKTAIDAAFDGAQGGDNTTTAAAIAASQLALDTNNGLDRAATGFTALVDTFNTAALVNDRLDALDAAVIGVAAAQDTIDALADAVTDATDAQALVDELATLNQAIADAEQAFTDEGLAVPVTLAAGANVATAASDIFKVGDADSSITNFNLVGSDTLFIGTSHTFNAGDVATDGDDATLEFFLSDNAGDAVVTLETVVFGSSASTPEVLEVTLTGVPVADVTVADGLLTVAVA